MAKKTKTTRTQSNVDLRTFVTACKEVAAAGGGHQEIADRLGIKRTSVATRISQCRTKYNLNMPSFPRGGGGGSKVTAEQISELNDLLAS